MEAPILPASSALNQQQAIRCKLAFNGELRCCVLASPSWDVLQDTAARLFNIGLAVDRPFKLRYVDDEGDAVSLDSTQELCEAVASAKATESSYLKLIVLLNASTGDANVQEDRMLTMSDVSSGRRCGKHGGKRAFHHFASGEMEALLTQLEVRGFGQRKKRNARLLRKMGGDVDAVVALLREDDAAAGQRRLARQQKKLAHAHANGVHHGANRGEKKTRRAKHDSSADDLVEAFISLAEGWPAGVNALYLDGNNMLFLSAALRKHALGRGQRWKAEAMLTSLAESFAHAKSATLQNTVMIYDSISKHRCCVKTLEGGTRFAVASARPEFATSDDALVAWAKALPPAQAKASLFVTSDRELKDRLIAAGVLVAKPKQWVELARRTVESASQRNAEQLRPEEGEECAGDQIRSEVSLDDFLEEWGKKLVLADADSATEETVGQARPSSDGMLFQ